MGQISCRAYPLVFLKTVSEEIGFGLLGNACAGALAKVLGLERQLYTDHTDTVITEEVDCSVEKSLKLAKDWKEQVCFVMQKEVSLQSGIVFVVVVEKLRAEGQKMLLE